MLAARRVNCNSKKVKVYGMYSMQGQGAIISHQEDFPDGFIDEFIEPVQGGNFEFDINYKACGFCKFADYISSPAPR